MRSQSDSKLANAPESRQTDRQLSTILGSSQSQKGNSLLVKLQRNEHNNSDTNTNAKVMPTGKKYHKAEIIYQQYQKKYIQPQSAVRKFDF